ncbi:NitT/TauT family transport system substrate-binding protein [Angulomicrobium tetraedrale]|uniref:NitT/TauT family transport system substrate-binding protein n=1 Tax=Ancylobacter tetraedralis TaxID=217068 RepID=A0A839Z813_9HYPH|nr:ABC transporter substrate-binding protein [Ancylobacter tetraedralis]MBB3770930.1 NitT/TauT family transport system substrate-binding protein [Ancylobacter tetraedralis]
MLTKTFRRCLAGAFAGAVLAAGAAQPALAGKISIGHTVWVGYGPLYLAKELGYFKENGVDVDFQVVDDSALAMAAQAAGKLDGTATTLDEILKYRSDNFCFKAVALFDESHGGDGMVSVKEINSLKELKGKTVALNEGSTSQFWFSYLLKKEGILLKDVEVLNMSADAAAAAFIAGQVPVAVTWEPNLTLVKTKNVGKVLTDSAATPGVIVDVLEISCSVLKDRPADVKGFVAGLQKAVDYIKTNPDKAYAIMAKGVGGYLKEPKDFADAASGVKFYDKAMTVEYLGTPDKPGKVTEVITLGNEIWTDLGKIKKPVGYAEIIDPSFTQ